MDNLTSKKLFAELALVIERYGIVHCSIQFLYDDLTKFSAHSTVLNKVGQLSPHSDTIRDKMLRNYQNCLDPYLKTVGHD